MLMCPKIKPFAISWQDSMTEILVPNGHEVLKINSRDTFLYSSTLEARRDI